MSRKEKEKEEEKNLLNADGSGIADVLCVDMLVCRCGQWWCMLMVVDGISSWCQWMRMVVDCGGGGHARV